MDREEEREAETRIYSGLTGVSLSDPKQLTGPLHWKFPHIPLTSRKEPLDLGLWVLHRSKEQQPLRNMSCFLQRHPPTHPVFSLVSLPMPGLPACTSFSISSLFASSLPRHRGHQRCPTPNLWRERERPPSSWGPPSRVRKPCHSQDVGQAQRDMPQQATRLNICLVCIK